MIEFLQKLFLGHVHKWELLQKTTFEDQGIYQGVQHIMQCKHCGKIKVQKDMM